mgnify:CR=1 FL=1
MSYNRDSDEALGKKLTVYPEAQRPLEPVVMRECLEAVAGECETQTEYDGQMLTHCFYCGSWLDENEHTDDCLHIKAKQMLGV